MPHSQEDAAFLAAMGPLREAVSDGALVVIARALAAEVAAGVDGDELARRLVDQGWPADAAARMVTAAVAVYAPSRSRWADPATGAARLAAAKCGSCPFKKRNERALPGGGAIFRQAVEQRVRQGDAFVCHRTIRYHQLGGAHTPPNPPPLTPAAAHPDEPMMICRGYFDVHRSSGGVLAAIERATGFEECDTP